MNIEKALSHERLRISSLRHYYQIHYLVKKIVEPDQSVFLSFCAPQGTGKTIAGLILGFYVAKEYDMDLIVEYGNPLRYFRSPPSDKVILLAEAGMWFNSRSFQTKVGRELQRLIQGLRVFHNFWILNVPEFSFLDKSIRDVFEEVNIVSMGKRRFYVTDYGVVPVPELSKEFLEFYRKWDREQKYKAYKELYAENA